jgi:hypothetical protein
VIHSHSCNVARPLLKLLSVVKQCWLIFYDKCALLWLWILSPQSPCRQRADELLSGDEPSSSRSSRITPGNSVQVLIWMEAFVKPRVSPDIVVKTKILAPAGDRTLALRLVTSRFAELFWFAITEVWFINNLLNSRGMLVPWQGALVKHCWQCDVSGTGHMQEGNSLWVSHFIYLWLIEWHFRYLRLWYIEL